MHLVTRRGLIPASPSTIAVPWVAPARSPVSAVLPPGPPRVLCRFAHGKQRTTVFLHGGVAAQRALANASAKVRPTPMTSPVEAFLALTAGQRPGIC